MVTDPSLVRRPLGQVRRCSRSIRPTSYTTLAASPTHLRGDGQACTLEPRPYLHGRAPTSPRMQRGLPCSLGTLRPAAYKGSVDNPPVGLLTCQEGRSERRATRLPGGKVGRLHVTQIEARLNSTVAPHLDVSDLAAHRDGQLRTMRNTRSLAASAAMQLGGMEAAAAAACVTDGSHDNGIDAIAVIPEEHRMIVVQAKWADDSRGSAALDDMIKFLEGLDDMVQFKWENFNERATDRREEIEELLLNPSVKPPSRFRAHGDRRPCGRRSRSNGPIPSRSKRPDRDCQFRVLGPVQTAQTSSR